MTQKNNFVQYLSLLLIIVGIFFGIIGVKNYVEFSEYATNGEVASATIIEKESKVEFRTHYNETSPTWYTNYTLTVSFRKNPVGSSFDIQINTIDDVEDGLWASKNKGEKVDVIYLKADAEKSMLKEQYDSQTKLVQPMIIISGFLFVVGLGIYIFNKASISRRKIG